MTSTGPVNSDLGNLESAYVAISTFDQWNSRTSERAALVADVVAEFEASKIGLQPHVIEAALSDSLNAAALETGAIEGLYPARTGITLSVIEGVVSYTTALSEMEDGDDHALINGQRLAFDLALDVMTASHPLSEAMIREIHLSTCAGQETYRVLTKLGWQSHALPKGEYKRNPNHVVLADGSTHYYAPVDVVADEMARLISETQTDSFCEASGVVQAAYLHHSLTHIHPFSDGNGRTARVVASIPLLTVWSVPLLVLEDRVAAYRSAQAQADVGDTQPFVSFVEVALLDVLGLITQRLRRASRSSDPDHLHRLVSGRSSDPDGRVMAAERLEELLKEALMRQFQEQVRIAGVTGEIRAGANGAALHGFSNRLTAHRMTFQAHIATGTKAVRDAALVAVADDPTQPRPVAVLSGRGEPLLVRVDELLPRPTQALRSRLEHWTAALLGAMHADLANSLGDDS